MNIAMGTCLLVMALASGFIQSVTSTIMFNVSEEAPLGTFVGSIPSATNLTLNVSSDEVDHIRYDFLSLNTNPMIWHFSLGTWSGVLTTGSVIDRELICRSSATCQLSFDVSARSTIGVFYRRISVVVVVIDINDNAPFFRPSAMTLNLREDLRYKFVTLDTAQDKDVGINSALSYDIIPWSNQFGVQKSKALNGDPLVLLELKEPLDRERESSFILHVRATDGGLPPLFGTLQVTINVLDVNDNAPVFSQDVYNISVPINVPVGKIILTSFATDADIGRNGEVFYRFSLQQPNANLPEIQKLFSIEETTGSISVIAPLANTHKTSFEFQIEAYDGGSPSLSSRADVFLRILYPPIIYGSFLTTGLNGEAVVSEGAGLNTSVFVMRVESTGTGNRDQIHCTVNDTNFSLQGPKGLFHKIKEYTMVAKSELDREQIDHISVRVTCIEQGIFVGSSDKDFEVYIADVNDNAPRFERDVYPVYVSENNPIGEYLTRVLATDSDVGKNSVISYSIPSPAIQTVSIDTSTGIILAKSVFDREKTSSIAFQVFAKDHGTPQLTGTTTVILNVVDVNDNVPQFSKPSYDFDVLKNVTIETVVGHVTAVDADAGENGRVSFSFFGLTNSTTSPFEITLNGTVRTSRVLNREAQHEYRLKVMAVDHGQPQMRSSAPMNIRLVDNTGQAVFG